MITTDTQQSADTAVIRTGDHPQLPGCDTRPAVLWHGVSVDADAELRQAQGNSPTNGGGAVEDRLS